MCNAVERVVIMLIFALQGWSFAPRFSPALAGWSPDPSAIRLVRRRRWMRLRSVPSTPEDPSLRSSAEDVQQLATDLVPLVEPNLHVELAKLWSQLELLKASRSELAEVVKTLERRVCGDSISRQQATVVADVTSESHEAVLPLAAMSRVEIISKNVDPQGIWSLVCCNGDYGFIKTSNMHHEASNSCNWQKVACAPSSAPRS